MDRRKALAQAMALEQATNRGLTGPSPANIPPPTAAAKKAAGPQYQWGVDTPNPNGESLLGIIDKKLGFTQGIKDAVWAFSHPVDRIRGVRDGQQIPQTMMWAGGAKGAGAGLGLGAGLSPELKALALRYAKRAGINPRVMNAALEKAQMNQVVTGARDASGAVDTLPQYTGGPTRPGRTYRVDMGDPGLQADSAELARTVIVQDPATGTMYATKGFHHGDLENYLAKTYGLKPGKWMQHEIFPPAEDIPGRVNFSVWGKDWLSKENSKGAPNLAGDSNKAVIGRARLLNHLQQDTGVKPKANPSMSEGRWRYTRKQLNEDVPGAWNMSVEEILKQAQALKLARPKK